MKILFVYPRFSRHAEDHPELLDAVPMNEYLGSPSLGIASLAAVTPTHWETEYRDDRLFDAAQETDAQIVALSFFTPAATRGLELARYFRAQGKTVVAGGIFPTMMPHEVQPYVDAVVIGEGEGVWGDLLEDWERGGIRPVYRRTEPLDVTTLPLPKVSLYIDQETAEHQPDDYPVQISRGCPLTCHACVLPTSMTRKLRVFDLDHVRGQIDQLAAAGKRACLTEDTSWFPGRGRKQLLRLFDELAQRPGEAAISYVGISMPMILSTPTAHFERAKAAGVDMFYLVGGFDPITMNAFTGKDDKAWQRGVDAIAKAWDVGIEPYSSFLLGGDQDDEGTVDRILEFTERTAIRKAEFALATPYPGTPSWHRLAKEERITTRDWSKYNDANVVFRPAQMSAEQLQDGYLRLWREFYARRGNLADLPLAERTIQF